MYISEYNENHKSLKSKSAYILKCPTVIVHDSVDNMDLNAFKTHGNSKSNKVFRPTMHSTFQQCKYSVATDEQLVYFILDEFESEDNIYQDLLIHHYQGMSDKFIT